MAAAHKILPSVLVDALVGHLHAAALGQRGVDLFQWVLPSSPAAAIGVYGPGGPDSPATPLSLARVQVIVRGTHVNSVIARADAVWRALAGATPPLPGLQGRLTADHLPGQPYRDSNNLFVQSLNFTYTGLTRVA